jgi:hypothetical protein
VRIYTLEVRWYPFGPTDWEDGGKMPKYPFRNSYKIWLVRTVLCISPSKKGTRITVRNLFKIFYTCGVRWTRFLWHNSCFTFIEYLVRGAVLRYCQRSSNCIALLNTLHSRLYFWRQARRWAVLGLAVAEIVSLWELNQSGTNRLPYWYCTFSLVDFTFYIYILLVQIKCFTWLFYVSAIWLSACFQEKD